VTIGGIARTASPGAAAIVGLAMMVGPAETAGSSGLEAGGFFLDRQSEPGWVGAPSPRVHSPFLAAPGGAAAPSLPELLPSTEGMTTSASPRAADGATTGFIPFTPRTYGMVLASPPRSAEPAYGESSLECDGSDADWSLGLGAGTEVGDLTISAGGAYGRNGPVDPTSCFAPDGDDESSGTAGVAIGLGDFTVGGSVLLAGDAAFEPGMGFQMGGSYAMDALTVGIDWGRQSVTDADGEMANRLELGASYSLAPGIAIDGRLGYIDLGSGTSPDDGGFLAGIGAAIDF